MAQVSQPTDDMEKQPRNEETVEDGDKGQDTFRWIIYLLTLEGIKFKTTQNSKSLLHAVLLDTQATGRNWISNQLIAKLGMESQVNRDCLCPNAYGFTGERIECKGTIRFQWMLHDGGTVHDPVTFHVSATPLKIDMIFGAPYIVERELLSSNRERFLPLITHKKIKLSEKARMALLEEEQRQQRARMEAKNQARREQTWNPFNIQVSPPSLRLQCSCTCPQASQVS